MAQDKGGVPAARPVDGTTGQPKMKVPVAPAGPAARPAATPNQPRGTTGNPPAAPVRSPAATPTPPAPVIAAPPTRVPTTLPGAPADAQNPVAMPTEPPPPSAPLPPDVLSGKAFRFLPSSEPIKLQMLVDEVVDRAKIQIIVTDNALPVLEKKVSLSAPVDIPTDKLLIFLASLLEAQGGMLTKDQELGFYKIAATSELVGQLGTERFATTRLIPTKGLRPTSLSQAINVALRGGGGGGAGGQAGGPQGSAAAGGSISFLDDLGVILMTDAPRKIDTVERIVNQLIEEQSKQTISYFNLVHITAGVAKQRMLELLGSRSARTPNDNGAAAAMQAAQFAAGGGAGPAAGSLSNIADRLWTDPQSNALVFRGREDEKEFITRLLKEVDRPSVLAGKWYPLGSSSQQLAIMGKRQGLGEIVTFDSPTAGNRAGGGRGLGFDLQNANPQSVANQLGNQQEQAGGPMFVIDPEGRGFMYFGTAEQQVAVEALSNTFGEFLKGEEIVLEFYKLKHGKSEDVSALMNEIIGGSSSGGSGSAGSLLPGGGSRDRIGGRGGSSRGGSSRGGLSRDNGNNNNGFDNQFSSDRRNDRLSNRGSGAGLNQNRDQNNLGARDRINNLVAPSDPNSFGAINANEDIAVMADYSNNTIVVKAPYKLQKQFKRLVERLDQRRPQVYIDAKIVVINASDSFRLAFETQLINANGTGGVVNTNFGLGALPAGTGAGAVAQPLLNNKTVSGTLGGLTAAIIKSDQVPLVLTALANTSDTRLVANPQLLVDDNETAEVASLDQRPTSTTNLGGSSGSTTSTTFSGFEPAGPRLTVTPQISDGNYMHLEYEVELSSFNGDPPFAGGPPAKSENFVNSVVTIPSDSTIIVGGLAFEQRDNTVIKVPFLGDIPIIGQLFRDERKNNSTRFLYVFITPRIMRDPNFIDLRMLTMGPDKVLKEGQNANQPMQPADRMEILPLNNRSGNSRPAAAPASLPATNPAQMPTNEAPSTGEPPKGPSDIPPLPLSDPG